ncbi:ubiquinol-cytochrome C chaperone [Azospirillum griseum]|uniref:Ubiquinol-cytochrome C chaperone n=1 Tax=Azospirillum griseum TaxID=2496639 RepID=A0A431VPD9_9PROT|nr:ubiquinol-cytochrome C chaperone [Azospirillum griseum]
MASGYGTATGHQARPPLPRWPNHRIRPFVLSTKLRVSRKVPAVSVSLFGRLFGRLFAAVGAPTAARPVDGLFAAIVTQARRVEFYRDLGVPDTLDGRFDLVALHCFLTMRRLKGQGARAAKLSQRLYERMVDDYEKSLMEMGVGDSGIGRRVKTMARGMAGRIKAYDEALSDSNDRRLEVALDNNVYGTAQNADSAHLTALAAYVRKAADGLDVQTLDTLLIGRLAFPTDISGLVVDGV